MTNPTLITTPFAENGDKNTIPESVGAEPQNATMQAGFPPITQQKTSEGGIPPERNDFNGILNLYGQHIVHLNKGLPYEFDQVFADAIGGYPLNARLMLDNGDIVKSTVPNNTSNPNVDMTGWIYPINPKQAEYNRPMLSVFVYGAKGDGVHDDTQAIKDAIADANLQNGDVWLPKVTSNYRDGVVPTKGFLVTEDLTIPPKVGLRKDSPIIYAGPQTKPVITLGQAAPANNTQFSEFINIDIWVLNKNTAEWGNDNSIGAWLYPQQFCNINIKGILGFDRGVVLNADKQGFVYNTVKIGELRGNRVGIHWLVTGTGWLNENTFIKGRISSTPAPAGQENTNRYGVIAESSGFNIQNNHWLNPCFELGSGSMDESIPISINNGSGNTFNNIRAEAHKKWIARFTGVSENNIITSDYGRLDPSVPSANMGRDFQAIDDQTTYKTNMFINSGYELLFRSFSKILYSGFSKDFYYANGNWGAIAGFANVSSSPLFPSPATYSSYAFGNSVDKSTGAISFGSATVRLVRRIKLNGAKRLVLKMSGANLGGVLARCFDSSLNLLYDGTTQYCKELNVNGSGGSPSASYGGCYTTNAPLHGVTVLGFLSQVEYVDILIGGSTSMTLSSIEISTPDEFIISDIPFFPVKTSAIKPSVSTNIQDGTYVANSSYSNKGVLGWIYLNGAWLNNQSSGLSNSITYDPPSIEPNASVTTNVTLNGVVVGDTVQASFSQYNAGVEISAQVSSANTVTVKFKNSTGSAIDMPSGTLLVKNT